jgi:hypothetical protein
MSDKTSCSSTFKNVSPRLALFPKSDLFAPSAGDFLAPMRVGTRAPGWLEAGIDDWIHSRTRLNLTVKK